MFDINFLNHFEFLFGAVNLLSPLRPYRDLHPTKK
jgi:hypothetical protein